MKLRFRHYHSDQSDQYGFGFNLWRSSHGRTLDIAIGRHLIAIWLEQK